MIEVGALQPGDLVPHFAVTTIDGKVFRYSTIWQQRHLVLVTLPDDRGDRYIASLSARDDEFGALGCTCVVTRDRIQRLPTAGALIADRWGEIVYVTSAQHTSRLPSVSDLLEWVDWVQRRCPECEGEAR